METRKPTYLQSLLETKQSFRTRRHSSPSMYLNRFGDHAFSIYAPRLWNSLPSLLKNTRSLSPFKSNLKTFLFRTSFAGDCSALRISDRESARCIIILYVLFKFSKIPLYLQGECEKLDLKSMVIESIKQFNAIR